MDDLVVRKDIDNPYNMTIRGEAYMERVFGAGIWAEFSVGDVDSHGMVEVRFGSAHDYECVDSEGKDQKAIPEWTSRLHRAYAMWLLDERIQALKRRADSGA